MNEPEQEPIDAERQRERLLAKEIGKAEDRATLWKCLAIAALAFLLFVILEFRGCLPTGGGLTE